MSNIMSFIELLNRVTDPNILNDSFINQPVLNKPCSASFVDKLEKLLLPMKMLIIIYVVRFVNQVLN